MSEDPKLKATVQRVVSLLARGEYEALERLTNGERLTAAEIREGVRDYGGSLVLPPDEAFDNLDVVEIEGEQPRAWGVRVDLWTAEEGRSDLTLELTLREGAEEVYGVEIDNVHAL